LERKLSFDLLSSVFLSCSRCLSVYRYLISTVLLNKYVIQHLIIFACMIRIIRYKAPAILWTKCADFLVLPTVSWACRYIFIISIVAIDYSFWGCRSIFLVLSTFSVEVVEAAFVEINGCFFLSQSENRNETYWGDKHFVKLLPYSLKRYYKKGSKSKSPLFFVCFIQIIFILLVLGIIDLFSSTCAQFLTTVRANFLYWCQKLKLFCVCWVLMEDRIWLSKLISISKLMLIFWIFLKLP